MKRIYFLSLMILLASGVLGQNKWKIAGNKITTPWAEKVDFKNPLPEYPRPQLVRENWKNLNGLWQYSIVTKSEDQIPTSFQGNILVPYAVESALSGVGKTVGKDSLLWYQTVIDLPSKMKGKKVLLHFGAVDWRSDVFVNGKTIGSHEGGYDPFSFDITHALKKGDKQQITIRVWDPTDAGPQPHGKQVVKPEGIWYTPVTGIWQTVWIEMVPETYIVSTTQTPDLDSKSLHVNATIENLQSGDAVNFSAWKDGEKIAEQNGSSNTVTLSIPGAQEWSPSNPFLYDLKITVMRKGKVVDEVKSYFAMRKVSIAPDQSGIQKMLLNNKFLFQFGPLDQGWWPDGLYTAPTDDALKFDIVKTKEMGFNMIRKHIKVEPARWYYYCDSIGIMVWQDMPSGDLGNHWESRPGVFPGDADRKRSAESEGYYRKEWSAIMETLHNFPSIVVWVPFNEAWGQFKTKEITEWTKAKDPSRLVNSASGGNFYPVGDIEDIHNYPDPVMPRPDLFGAKKALVLGEYGGLGLPFPPHTWQENKNWGYQSFKNADDLFNRYQSLNDKLEDLIRHGLSAAVYTQTTDVEGEVNGFMTYDRKVIKMPLEKLKQANKKLYDIK